MNQNEQQVRMNELITRSQEQEKQMNEILETMKDKKLVLRYKIFFWVLDILYLSFFPKRRGQSKTTFYGVLKNYVFSYFNTTP